MAKKLTPTQKLEKELNEVENELHSNSVRFEPDKKLAERLNKKRLELIKKLGRKP